MNHFEQSENEEESEEQEGGPEWFATEKAVTALEHKDENDPVISSKWVKTKKIGKVLGVSTGILVGLPLVISYRILKESYQFAKKAIEKKGGSYGAGYEIGKTMGSFSLNDKKDKK